MIYIQFYHPAVTNPSKQFEACGDRSIIILDGRQSLKSHIHIALDELKRRNYSGVQIRKAENLNRPYKVLWEYLPIL
jgi:hypothetical protein